MWNILFFLINIQNHVEILQIGIYLVLWIILVLLYDTMFDTVDLYMMFDQQSEPFRTVH